MTKQKNLAIAHEKLSDELFEIKRKKIVSSYKKDMLVSAGLIIMINMYVGLGLFY